MTASRSARKAVSWIDRLSRFFRDRDEALGHVLEAAGCREGWLHGELHRQFRGASGFALNQFSLDDGETADLFADSEMVGELKILGAGYQRKVITGGSLKAFSRRSNRIVTAADTALNLGPWGLVPDYFRLVQARVPRHVERLLILIADVTDDATDSVADALRTIEFKGDRRHIGLSRGFVRIWKLAVP